MASWKDLEQCRNKVKQEDRAGRAEEVSNTMKWEMSDRMGKMERKTK